VQYYIAHGGIVAAALLLVIGLRLHPRPFAVAWVGLLALVYAGLLGLVDAATGANYMYLGSKPLAPTLLDLMGPWPWYLLGAVALGVLFLAILDAPFYFGRRRAQIAMSRLFGLPIRRFAPPSPVPGEVSGGPLPPSLVLLFDGT
jgi:uncharacterized membrane protein YwaF